MIDLIFVGIADAISIFLEGIIGLLLPCLGFDFTAFSTAFPYAADAFVIFQKVAIGIILLIAAVQIAFFFIAKEQNRSTPIRIAFFTFFAVGGVYYGNYILEAIMVIAQLPYDALLNTGVDFAGLDAGNMVVWIGCNDLFYGISPLLYIVVLLMIGIAFIKLLLEAIERYVVLFGLIYLSPLAASTIASDATNGIFKRYFTMFLSQCLLLILNVWSLKMTISLFRSLPDSAVPMFTLLIGYAFIRFASRIDSYLNSLGMNAAVTGAGLGAELMASGMAMLAGASALGGGKMPIGNAGGKSGGGNILTDTASRISNFAEKWSPGAAIGNAAKSGLGAVAKTAGEAFNQAKDAAAAGASPQEWFKTAQDAWGANWQSNWSDAQNQMGHSMIFRGAFGDNTIGDYTMFSPSARQAVENNAYMADQAFNSNSDGGEMYDSASVSSIANGIGLEGFDQEAQEAIAVGNGTLPAENMEYSKTADGLHMGYSRDGKDHEWDVKNSTQYAALSPDEQQMYAPFKSKDGHQYYARHISSRAPTDAQKKQTAINADLDAFKGNPGAKLSADAQNAIRRDPSQLSAMYQNMRDNGTRITADTPEGRSAIAQALSLTPTDNKLNDGKQLAMANLNNGTADGAYMDGNGIHVPWTNSAGETSSFDLVAPGAQIDASVLDDGYRANYLSNGDLSYAKYTAPPTPLEKDLQAFTSNPGTIISADAQNAIRRDPSQLSAAYQQMRTSGTTISSETPEGRQAIHQLLSLTPTDSKLNDGKQLTMAQLSSGGPIEAFADGNGIHAAWTDKNNAVHSFEVVAPGANVDVNSLNSYKPYNMANGEVVMAEYYDPTASAARESQIFSKASSFGSAEGPSAVDFGYVHTMPVAKKNDFVNKVFDGAAQKHKTVTITESNSGQFSDMVRATNWNGVSKNNLDMISSGLSAYEDGSTSIQAEFNERGCYAKTEHGAFQVLTNKAISTSGAEVDSNGKSVYDRSTLENEGFVRNNINGQEYWSRFVPANKMDHETDRMKKMI